MENKKFGAITSSQDPEQISNRIKGLTLACSSIIIFLASQFLHIKLDANDVVSLATELGMVAGAITTIYGFGMKAWAYFYRDTQ